MIFNFRWSYLNHRKFLLLNGSEKEYWLLRIALCLK